MQIEVVVQISAKLKNCWHLHSKPNLCYNEAKYLPLSVLQQTSQEVVLASYYNACYNDSGKM